MDVNISLQASQYQAQRLGFDIVYGVLMIWDFVGLVIAIFCIWQWACQKDYVPCRSKNDLTLRWWWRPGSTKSNAKFLCRWKNRGWLGGRVSVNLSKLWSFKHRWWFFTASGGKGGRKNFVLGYIQHNWMNSWMNSWMNIWTFEGQCLWSTTTISHLSSGISHQLSSVTISHQLSSVRHQSSVIIRQSSVIVIIVHRHRRHHGRHRHHRQFILIPVLVVIIMYLDTHPLYSNLDCACFWSTLESSSTNDGLICAGASK